MALPYALVDTHAHWHFPDFNSDRNQAFSRAQENGIQYFINVGTDLMTSRLCVELAEKFPFIFASVGFHPHDAERMTTQDFLELEKLATHPRVKAIGEVGLDFFRNLSPREVQEKVLGLFLDLHWKTGKPLILHTRDAYPEMADMLRRHQNGQYRGVMHCYSSDAKGMEPFLELGFYISFAGPLTYKKNHALREACKLCPPDRVLVETDAPYLPPEPYRGKRNESAFLIETAKVAAGLHGLSLDEFACLTTDNAKRLFAIC